MEKHNRSKIDRLIEKGVKIFSPYSIEIGDDVSVDRISGDDVIIYSGCKIFGDKTFIAKGARLGYEAPVTVENCQIGPYVHLKGGFFRQTVLLANATVGSGACFRESTILEEGARAAHTVGLKQTILFPFVTLGSLINFCDCLMSGGTSSRDHSEVGSSYIHFNYTPNQDKATPSLIGDVCHGVMLNRPPIFLGGQGGLVGPCKIEFGTVIAAGSICRKDQLKQGMLVFEPAIKGRSFSFKPGIYNAIKRIVLNNIIYIANLFALKRWYLDIRRLFISDNFPDALFNGLKFNIDTAIEERIKRFNELCFKMPLSIESYLNLTNKEDLLVKQKRQLYQNREKIEIVFREFRCKDIEPKLRDDFIENIDKSIKEYGNDYISIIKGLAPDISAKGSKWLCCIVNNAVEKVLENIPYYK